MLPCIGQRVVRGPDWEAGEEDGGEGGVGTVIKLTDDADNDGDGATFAQASNIRTKTNGKVQKVSVVWDISGVTGEYRTGQDGRFDLRGIDLEDGGTHILAICNGCGKKPTYFRWYCTTCTGYDLCSPCYNADTHDLDHQFVRYVSFAGSSLKVPTRESSSALKLEAKGLFAEAKVSKGDKTGKVTETVEEGEKEGVKVKWDGVNTITTHMRGEAGDIDVTCEEPAVYGTYYKDHMPVIGERKFLRVGDLASVLESEDSVKELQKDHGDWVPKMSEALRQVGIVVAIAYRGEIKLCFPAISKEWNFNLEAVTRVESCGIGDTVRITEDEELVRKVQPGHGGWDDSMSQYLGQEGLVLTVGKEGNVKVMINGQSLTLHPACLTIVKLDGERKDTDWKEAQKMMMLRSMADQLLMSNESPSAVNLKKEEVTEFMQAALDGKLTDVQDGLERNPTWVNISIGSKTALHAASIGGHMDVAKYLISKGTFLDASDDNDLTPLHLAVLGKKPQMVEYLLKQGAYASAVSSGGSTPLHFAAHQNISAIAALLLKHGANINIQDKARDTVLHLAISRGNKECQRMFIESPKMDLTIRNLAGYNALSLAALFKAEEALNRIIEKDPELVNIRKSDGYAPLHVAALKNHAGIVQILLDKGKCSVNMLTTKKETPLYLAVERGGMETIELLVSRGADINQQDIYGHFCLFILLNLMRETHYKVEDTVTLRKIRASMREIGLSSPKEALLCYLVQQGGDMGAATLRGNTPWDLLKDPKLKTCVEKCIAARQDKPSMDEPSLAAAPQKKHRNSLLARFLPFLNKDPAPVVKPEYTPVVNPATAANPAPAVNTAQTAVNPAPAANPSQPSANQSWMEATDMNGDTSSFQENNSMTSPEVDLPKSPSDDPPLLPLAAVPEPQPSDIAIKEDQNIGIASQQTCSVCQQPITELMASPCQHAQPMTDMGSSGAGAEAAAVPSSPALAKEDPAGLVSGLRRQNTEFRLALACSVCLQRKKDVVFECGHSTCRQCSELLPDCPVCRQPASKVFPLFL